MDQKPRLVFAQVTGPDRLGWPVHGEFAFLGPHWNNSPSVFSQEVANEIVEKLLNQGVVQEDALPDFQEIYRSMRLPKARTRYDQLRATFDDEAFYRFMGQITRTASPDEGSGPARFQPCEGGNSCKSAYCHRYPVHGNIVPRGLNCFIGYLLFTELDARELCKTHTRETGAFEQQDGELIERQIKLAGFTNTPQTIRAGKICRAGLSPEDQATFFNHIFEITCPRAPARWASHDFRCHLICFDDRVYEDRINSKYEACVYLAEARGYGLFSDEDYSRLIDEIDQLPLEEGGPPPDPKEIFEGIMHLLAQED